MKTYIVHRGLRSTLSQRQGVRVRNGQSSREPPLSALPLWALRADLAFAKQKLTIAIKRKAEGKPPHGRFANYDLVLKERIEALEREIKSRRRDQV